MYTQFPDSCQSISLYVSTCPSICQLHIYESVSLLIYYKDFLRPDSCVLDVSSQSRTVSGAASVLLGDIWLSLMLRLTYLLWLWTVWWHLSVLTVVGEQDFPFFSTVTQCWQGWGKFILCLLGAWPGSARTDIDCGSLSLIGLGWYRHFPVGVKRQLHWGSGET